MGVIADVIEQAEHEPADHEGDSDPLPSQVTIDPSDPFLSSYNTEQIKLDDQTTNLLLGIAVVISNIFS